MGYFHEEDRGNGSAFGHFGGKGCVVLGDEGFVGGQFFWGEVVFFGQQVNGAQHGPVFDQRDVDAGAEAE